VTFQAYSVKSNSHDAGGGGHAFGDVTMRAVGGLLAPRILLRMQAKLWPSLKGNYEYRWAILRSEHHIRYGRLDSAGEEKGRARLELALWSRHRSILRSKVLPCRCQTNDAGPTLTGDLAGVEPLVLKVA
jgi:hypothetical protein